MPQEDTTASAKTQDSEAVRDAELVKEFLRLQEVYWREQADAALRDGSMNGAMQYHAYAEALHSTANTVGAFNGKGAPWENYPQVTLAQAAESLQERRMCQERADFLRDFEPVEKGL